MSNVIDLPVITTLNTDPQRVLQRASEKGLAQVVVVGYDADGKEFFASSVADGGEVVSLPRYATAGGFLYGLKIC